MNGMIILVLVILQHYKYIKLIKYPTLFVKSQKHKSWQQLVS